MLDVVRGLAQLLELVVEDMRCVGCVPEGAGGAMKLRFEVDVRS